MVRVRFVGKREGETSKLVEDVDNIFRLEHSTNCRKEDARELTS
jgi:hypothetical protein